MARMYDGLFLLIACGYCTIDRQQHDSTIAKGDETEIDLDIFEFNTISICQIMGNV